MTSTPPLLLLAEGRRPRPRKTPKVRAKEHVLHTAVAKLLRVHAREDWRWTHIAAGELRDKRTAAKLKSMGLQRGWPDFVLLNPFGQLHALELKRAGEELSEAQEDFKLWCIRSSVPHCVAYSIDHVLVAFADWDCLAIDPALLRGKGGAA